MKKVFTWRLFFYIFDDFFERERLSFNTVDSKIERK